MRSQIKRSLACEAAEVAGGVVRASVCAWNFSPVPIPEAIFGIVADVSLRH